MARWPFRRTLPPGAVRSETADIREEIELHLELRAQELVREGVPPEEARSQAERHFGDVARIEAQLRRGRRRSRRDGGRGAMGSLKRDLAYALRTFRRNPGFAAVAVLTLGIALGGNTAIFSVVDAALLRALPFPQHEGLVVLQGYQDRQRREGRPGGLRPGVPRLAAGVGDGARHGRRRTALGHPHRGWSRPSG